MSLDIKTKYSALISENSSKENSFDGENGDLEKVAFLKDGPDTNSMSKPRRSISRWMPSWKWNHLAATVLPWTLVGLLSLVLLSTVKLNKEKQHWYTSENKIEHYTAASVAGLLEYEDKVFIRGFGPEDKYFSEYAGWPSDELDTKWDALYERGIGFIDADSHSQLLNKSVRTPIAGLENTYMTTLDVFHQIHCLNSIRKYFYPSRYNMTFLSPDGHKIDYEKWVHMDHCINSIRQSLMCNADVTTVGYDWFPEIHLLRTRLNSVHRCRNWDTIQNWADEHHAPYDGHNSHVDEGTGRVVDFGGTEDLEMDDNTHFFEPEDWRYTKDDM